jgi:Flp pilus assembly protein TadD
LGFYYLKDKEYDKTLEQWRNAYSGIEDDLLKAEILKLIEGLEDNINFEQCKELILSDEVKEGLKRLIPLMEKHGDWSEVKYYTALGFRKLHNYKKSEILLCELLESGENFSEIYNELGLCYFNMGEIDKAVKHFNTAVSLKDDEPGYLCNLAIALYHQGDKYKVKELIDKACALNPEDELVLQCKKWADGI